MIAIRALTHNDAGAFRAIRLEGLRNFPGAFGASYQDTLALTEADFAERIASASPGAMFGAFADDTLIGVAGLAINTAQKTRHKGFMWGVYVRPAFQGQGIGKRLVEAVIDRARQSVVVLQSGVQLQNHAARLLYESLGFTTYGIETKALCIDGQYYDEAHLALDFTAT
jgi:ribosomal protein S18 acetylase RimI-like enzyme